MLTGNLTKGGAKGLGGEIPGNLYIGIQGPVGKTPELSVGYVETLPPESPATVEISGTKEKPILNFRIPQGKTGESSGGGVNFEPDETLRLENGVLSVNTIDKVIEDDARPITSGAVYNEFSMAVALLKTI